MADESKKTTRQYDWAQAAFELAQSEAVSLADMAEAAGLDPIAGDLSHIDLRDTSIERQDLERWNLEFARLDRCRVKGAKLRGAKLSAEQIIEAIDWRAADIDDLLMEKARILDAATLVDSLFTHLVSIVMAGMTDRIYKILPPNKNEQVLDLATDTVVFQVKQIEYRVYEVLDSETPLETITNAISVTIGDIRNPPFEHFFLYQLWQGIEGELAIRRRVCAAGLQAWYDNAGQIASDVSDYFRMLYDRDGWEGLKISKSRIRGARVKTRPNAKKAKR